MWDGPDNRPEYLLHWITCPVYNSRLVGLETRARVPTPPRLYWGAALPPPTLPEDTSPDRGGARHGAFAKKTMRGWKFWREDHEGVGMEVLAMRVREDPPHTPHGAFAWKFWRPGRAV